MAHLYRTESCIQHGVRARCSLALHLDGLRDITLYNCRLLDKKVRQTRGINLGIGVWYCFRDLGVNKSNTYDILI